MLPRLFQKFFGTLRIGLERMLHYLSSLANVRPTAAACLGLRTALLPSPLDSRGRSRLRGKKQQELATVHGASGTNLVFETVSPACLSTVIQRVDALRNIQCAPTINIAKQRRSDALVALRCKSELHLLSSTGLSTTGGRPRPPSFGTTPTSRTRPIVTHAAPYNDGTAANNFCV